MFLASSGLKTSEVLLDRYSPTPYHYATLKVDNLPPGLNQGGKWLEGDVWLGTGTGDTWPGVNDLRSAWRNGRASDYIAIEQHFYWCLFKLLLAKNV